MDLLSSSLPLPAALGARSRAVLQPWVQQLARLRELRQLYEQVQHLSGLECVAAILQQLGIRVDCDPAELRRVPAGGAFIAVANHPSGMLDGLVLLHVLAQVRPEIRAVANELLAPLLPQLRAQLVLVQPQAGPSPRNVPGVRQLLRYLHNDVPLLLFPAGEVAHSTRPFQPATDAPWHPTAGRLMEAARLPVLPIWLSSRNGPAFSWLGLVHPLLRTIRLPAELLNKRGQTVQVRIGQPVTAAELHGVPALARLAYLRARVHALASPAAGDAATLAALTPATAPVVAETAAVLIEADLAALRPGRCLLRHRHWEVYVAKSREIPQVLREIGRLREVTFRREGEGSGQALDLDRYDDYYRHLFLYDRAARRLVGAYRLGPGRGILHHHGKRGFYLHSLFRLGKELRPLLLQSVELGRSFVRAEYQRQPLPLALLWKGIAAYLDAHPGYRYLIGPVSISSRFSEVSKSIITAYIRRHCFDEHLAAHVRPRKPFRYRPLDGADPTEVLQAGLGSVETLDRLIGGIEPGGAGVPVMLRQYLRQNARFIGFNIDPAFSNVLDGFLVLDAHQLPERTRRLLDRYGSDVA
ncbi:lysophospholipid acyltransferase family protein [Hymenobacter sp. B81]|uniref:lysophospholipid acyltransferase family protein n=1 Tax=Hymenobacter sp. B81 TaxID=3344878 RepID=UPI0037DC3A4F